MPILGECFPQISHCLEYIVNGISGPNVCYLLFCLFSSQVGKFLQMLWVCIFHISYISFLFYVFMHEVASVVSDSLWPYGSEPTRLLCPWDSPEKNTGVGCHALLQGIFPTPGLKSESLTSPALEAGSLLLVPPGKPHVPWLIPKT